MEKSRSIKKCKNCGNDFSPNKKINIYCGQRCYGLSKSKELAGIRPKQLPGFKKGSTPHNKGKMIMNRECGNCKKRFRNSHPVVCCSRKCSIEYRSSPKGIRKIRQDIRRLSKYQEWRQGVIKRDGGRCMKCGSTNSIEVDHFPKTLDTLVKEYNITFSIQANDVGAFWDIANGRLLCRNCHAKTMSSKNTRVTIRNSSVCVTGGAGMIGSHLVEELIKRGNKVLVIDNLYSGDKRFIPKEAEFIWFDLRFEPDRLSKILKERNIQYVFHLASLPYIPNCFDDPTPFFWANAGGTMNTLIACEDANVKKVLVYSSAEIYGTKSFPIKESDKLNPQSTYGVAKVAADQMSKIRYVESGLPVVINRQFNVFSWRARHPYIIPEIIQQLSVSNTVHLGNVYSYRDFLYIDDAVSMAIELLEKGSPGEEYNLGDENIIRIDDLAKRVGKILGHKSIKIIVDKERLRPWDIAFLQADTTKLKNTIKYRPRYSLDDGLKKVIERYKQNGSWDF